MWGWEFSSMAEYLPGRLQVPGSTLSTKTLFKKKKILDIQLLGLEDIVNAPLSLLKKASYRAEARAGELCGGLSLPPGPCAGSMNSCSTTWRRPRRTLLPRSSSVRSWPRG